MVLVKTIPKATQEGQQPALLKTVYFMTTFSLFRLYKKLFPTVEAMDPRKQFYDESDV